ncbi:MAG: Mur ligase family protein [Gemmatimonadetes bacterium]|nr:Mur ligase family protein [Gemmatimonadota bacterium]
MPHDVTALLFEDSRRLTGPNFWLGERGVILDAALHSERATAEIAAWRDRVAELTGPFGWRTEIAVRRDGSRAVLAFTAPLDALYTATLINEWAWTLAATDGIARAAAMPPPDDEPLPVELPQALERLHLLLAAEANPALVAMAERAARENVPFLSDDELVTVGYGARSETWPARAVPSPDAVEWKARETIPVALVTGSNGKTTTTRLVAAMLAKAGHTVGFCCSDGVFVAGEQIESGDWSGPGGARLVLRNTRVTAAVLETARGGLLRRGLAVPYASAAIVTNIAEDHFGGYGIRSLADLAAVKLCAANALASSGTLVLNSDDETLRMVARNDDEAGGGVIDSATSRREARTVRDHAGHVNNIEWFSAGKLPDWMPLVSEMPITRGGAAAYNVANAIGAAHVARALGVASTAIEMTLREFGTDNADNPGRLERFDVKGVQVWIDYAHNPHGLAALLTAARAEKGAARMGLLLGQAGDRDDDAIRALARTAWDARPERIVLKDLDGYSRGRAPGEVPALLRNELLIAGAPADTLEIVPDEVAGVRALIDWSRAGDLLVLPVHALEARAATIALIDRLGGAVQS